MQHDADHGCGDRQRSGTADQFAPADDAVDASLNQAVDALEVGSTITIFHRRSPDDWVEIGETTDTTFADGQPGFGFFVRDLGQTIDAIGLRDYTVTEIR